MGLIDRRVLDLAPRQRAAIGVLVMIRLGITATFVGQALLFAHLLVSVFEGPVTVSAPLLASVIILSLIRATLTWLLGLLETRTGSEAQTAIRLRIVAKLIELGPAFTDRQRTGSLEATILEGASSVASYVGTLIPLFISAVTAFIVLLALVVLIDPIAGLIVLVSALLVPAAPVVSERAFGDAGRKFWASFSGLAAEYLDALQGMTTLKVFDAQARWGDRLREKSEDVSQDAVALSGLSSMYIGFVSLGVAAGTTVSVAKGAFQFAGGGLSALALLMLLFLAREVLRPLIEFQAAAHPAALAVAAGGEILKLLAVEPEVTDSARQAPSPPSLSPTVTFADVSFSYVDDAPPALNDLSFDAGGGETIAIVGRSGAGKTTIVSLLLRFFEPATGRIEIGGRDIRDLPIDAVRALIAVVPQETYLFHRSIRDNLLVANPGASDDELVAAAQAAHAHGFISQLPDGYDTRVGERGARLSGGERQRIAIARALLKDAPILILDEATSSVDAESEGLIQASLAGLTRTRTSIVIAHRLSTVRNADRILVLEHGHLVESGPPEELVRLDGVYARLMAAQEAT